MDRENQPSDYTLSELIELALKVPEAGAVNFNVLRTALHAIVDELRIGHVRPPGHAGCPFLDTAALVKAKLRGERPPATSAEAAKKDVIPGSYEGTGKTDEVSSSPEGKTTREDVAEKTDEVSSSPEGKTTRSDVAEKTDEVSSSPEGKTARSDVAGETDEVSSSPEGKTTRDDVAGEANEVSSSPEGEIALDDPHQKSSDLPVPPAGKQSKDRQIATKAWRSRSMETRVEATEEGLQKLSDVMDEIVNKLKQAEQRKKEGGPMSEELEAMYDTLMELQEQLAQYAADHALLMEMNDILKALLEEFEGIKALAAQIKQMQRDIATKADDEDIRAALELKADLELVNTKVDWQEFQYAIEELGEAIGLLGLKFTRKNDEWEERAAAMWAGIDSKMTRDVFEEARRRIESRITALMFGLRKLKDVVEGLLYPESAGVTRCILCRRPACISGLECLGMGDSPQRPLPDESSSDKDDSVKLKRAASDVTGSTLKLLAPPRSKSRDTLVTGGSGISVKTTQVPKLPLIDGAAPPKPKPGKTVPPVVMPRLKPQRQPKEELYFTNRMLAKIEREEEEALAKQPAKESPATEEPQRTAPWTSSRRDDAVKSPKTEMMLSPETWDVEAAAKRLSPR